MKKFIMLFLIAAGVGLLLSRSERVETDDNGGEGLKPVSSTETRDDPEPAGEATADSEAAGKVSGEESGPLRQKPLAAGVIQHGDGSGGSGFSPGSLSFVLPERERKDSYQELYRSAEELVADNELAEARRLLTEIYLGGDGNRREEAAGLLEEINEKLVFDPQQTQGATIHRVQSGETLSRIASRYGVSWRMLQRINHISRPELIRVNQAIKVIEGEPRIVIDKSNFTLTLFIDDYYVRRYPVGLGRDNRTPVGRFTVDSLLEKADWYPPGGGIIRYGEEGHLIGTRWIGFEDRPGAAGYGIHGTDEPDSIGQMRSEGCIRMLNEDVEELYDFLTPGIEVKIID